MKKFLLSNLSIKISIGFFLAFLTIIIVQYLSDDSIDKLKDSQQEMMKSNMLISKVSMVESAINSYDGKISDFVCTGNDLFIKNNDTNLKKIISNMTYLQSQELNSEQKSLINKLDSLVKEEIQIAQKTLADYYSQRNNREVPNVDPGMGESVLDNIAIVATSFQTLETDNISLIKKSNDAHTQKMELTNELATAFALIVIFISVLVLLRDIRRRNVLEKELRFAEKQAYKVAEMKEQFMANMSHEIRTPMNAILGFANFLNHTKLDSKQQEYINAIRTSGENLLTIINDILDFSKIEAGMLRIENISFSPADMLHSLQMMFSQKANDKNLSLNFNIDSGIPPTVSGDPTRLTQILVNIINNAIKFTEQGGVSVTAKVDSESKDEITLEFQIKDSGIGISPENLKTIFDRFNQADTDTTRKFGGSGLGLSIVKKLVELQKGQINVDSNLGLGSVFTFRIPYKKNPDVQSFITSPNIIPTASDNINSTVLVVEDNPMNQKLAQSLLDYWGFSCEIANNGRIALEKLKVKKFNLILMDIQMPELNGYDTTSAIRLNLRIQTPIIAMTAHALPGEREKCLSFGMNDYISKPIRENELLQLINKYIATQNIHVPEKSENKREVVHPEKNINLQYLNDLANGNPDFVKQMIQLFLTEAPQELAKLEQAVNLEDFTEIYSIAHKFKSTTSFVGIDNSDLAAIEKSAKGNLDLEEIRNRLNHLKSVCAMAIVELKNYKSA
jgi:signal transduction histidine kinase/CheY-like chemotaxis protein/HPt (histidine-containing phosphotransfer) domain-containing protein